jgi:integrase
MCISSSGTASARPRRPPLRWKHVDLKKKTANIRESYNEGRYEQPKTKSARRTIDLHPEFVRLARVLQPAHVTPEAPVFTSLAGTPVEPKTFSERHWYDCLRALKLRVRGLYCTKDTFVTVSFGRMPDNVLWVERQTGVAYQTLRKHYAAWLPQASNGIWGRLTPSDCGREDGSVSAIAATA